VEEVSGSQIQVGEIPFQLLLGLSLFVLTTVTYRFYAFPYDRELKRTRLEGLLTADLVLSGGFVLPIVLLVLTGTVGFDISRDPLDYLWTVLGLVAAQSLLLQAPAIFISKGVDRATLAVITQLTSLLALARYGTDAEMRAARDSIEQLLAGEEALLKDYGLDGLAKRSVDSKLAVTRPEVSDYLQARLDSARNGLSVVESPFVELNRILSVAGAAALGFIALLLD
jgi:hypothetical protein